MPFEPQKAHYHKDFGYVSPGLPYGAEDDEADGHSEVVGRFEAIVEEVKEDIHKFDEEVKADATHVFDEAEAEVKKIVKDVEEEV